MRLHASPTNCSAWSFCSGVDDHTLRSPLRRDFDRRSCDHMEIGRGGKMESTNFSFSTELVEGKGACPILSIN